MRTPENGKEAENRRRRALAMAKDGHSAASIGQTLGVDPRTVRRWKAAVREHGPAALKTKISSGRPHRLSAKQRRDLTRRLLRGAVAEGFSTDLWTCPRICHLIEQRYAVRYHVDHIPRLMRTLGFSPQKAERRARERDEEAIQDWIARDWRRIKKRPPD
jgi:transposase